MDRLSLFEEWAAGYDAVVQAATGFPFEGYPHVLAAAVAAADAPQAGSVLDVGTGTGGLARLFVERGCAVTGIDLSPAMLALAKKRVPAGEFLQIDLRGDWGALDGRRFNVITSAYVFHEFNLATKVSLVERLARDHLRIGGRIVIADISFATRRAHERARRRWRRVWDEEECYWTADEAIPLIKTRGLAAHYRQVSTLAGIYCITPLRPHCSGRMQAIE